MATADFGPWQPMTLRAVVECFADAPFRWWVSGGHALELHVGQSWRAHDDIDISLVRADAIKLSSVLDGWDIHLAAAGVLSSWDGSALDPTRSENNLWGRTAPGEPWALDITISDGTESEWVYRRNPDIRRSWHDSVLSTAAGTPYLAPELQLLFKSANRRDKDDVDARVVIPLLDADRCLRLRDYLPVGHPWHRLIDQ